MSRRANTGSGWTRSKGEGGNGRNHIQIDHGQRDRSGARRRVRRHAGEAAGHVGRSGSGRAPRRRPAEAGGTALGSGAVLPLCRMSAERSERMTERSEITNEQARKLMTNVVTFTTAEKLERFE